jgi:hypothetical protein
MKNAPRILTVAGLVLIFVFFINSISQPDNNPSKNTSDLYEIKALKIPSNLSFCGEKVPLKKDDVRERIDRELLVNTYWQSNGLLFLKRSNKYFPTIEPILKKYNVPDDFKYLALIESGLQNITSPAGAKGFWQLMPKTAKEYGLEVNANVDERYNLEKSTEAACKYLLDAYEKFGNWTLAAAAYNAGMSGINKQIDRQKVTDYYDLLLGDETSRYVPRIVAVKEILNHPKKYGFIFDNDDLYRMIPTREIKVDTAIANLADFAKDRNINYKELKILNPWLRENKLNNKSRKLYYIRLPR